MIRKSYGTMITDTFIKNADAHWNQFDTGAYHHSYHQLIPEDAALTKAFITCVTTSPQLQRLLGTGRQALDVCNGGVLRNIGLIYPFLCDDAHIVLADIGQSQLATAAYMLNEAKADRLGIWHSHQQDMARHPLWKDAITKASKKSKVVALSIFDLPKNTFDVITTFYGPESLTEDPAEYVRAVHTWLDSGRSGAVAIMAYTAGSSGYMAGDVRFPALSVDRDTVERVVKSRLQIIAHVLTPASGAMRTADDPTDYKALGLLIGIIKDRPA